MRLPIQHLLASFLFLALLSACGGGGGGGDDASDQQTPLPGIYVNAVSGDDATGDGSPERPFRTITMALQAAKTGDVVRVGPGLYDALHGEVFPLEPAAGVAVRGTQNLTIVGGPKPLTRVVGGGTWDQDPEGRLHGTFVPGPGASLTGLSIHNPEVFGPFDGPKPAAIILASADVTVDSCVLHESDKGIRLVAGAKDSRVTNTTLRDNAIGLLVSVADSGTCFERCKFLDNNTGVMVFAPGVDFGGGAAGSEGGNVFAGSDTNDLVFFTGALDVLSAQNCFWDVQAPTVATGQPPSLPTADIWQHPGSVDTQGASKFRSQGPVALPDIGIAR